MRIYREFHFEAAHVLPGAHPGTANARLHGHSLWLRNRLQSRVPGLAAIESARDGCHEGCVYSGRHPARLAAE